MTVVSLPAGHSRWGACRSSKAPRGLSLERDVALEVPATSDATCCPWVSPADSFDWLLVVPFGEGVAGVEPGVAGFEVAPSVEGVGVGAEFGGPVCEDLVDVTEGEGFGGGGAHESEPLE